MNTASKNELEDFQKSTAPEQFDLSAPASNTLLPGTSVAISRRVDRSVEIDLPQEGEALSTPSAEVVLTGMERSARHHIDRFPRSARAHANLGIALLKKGQTEEACKELEFALDLEPTNYLAAITLARLHVEAGRIADALHWYEKLTMLYPESAAVEIGLSNVLIHAGNFPKAHPHLSRAMELDPRNPYVHFLLGVICLQKSDLRGALNEFRAASNLDFRSPNLYHAMGVAYVLQGDYPRAEKAFKTALNLAPDSANTVVSLGSTLLAFGKSDRAITILQDFLERHPDDLQGRNQLAAAYMQAERYGMVRAQISKILEGGSEKLSPEEISRHHTNIAVSFMYEKSFDRAATELEMAIKAAPSASSIPYDNLARVYAHTNKKPLAIRLLEKATTLFPSSRDTYLLLSILYAEQERFLEAISLVEKLRQLGPLSDENYASLGYYYGELNLAEKAMDVLMEGYEKFPKSMSVINNLAYFLLMEGQVAQAKQVLDSRPRNVEDRVELVATIGLLHLKQGDYDSARRLYKHAEGMASKTSRKELARQVRQKMHLELARYHIARGEYDLAKREISAGLNEKHSRQSFVDELIDLEQLLQAE